MRYCGLNNLTYLACIAGVFLLLMVNAAHSQVSTHASNEDIVAQLQGLLGQQDMVALYDTTSNKQLFQQGTGLFIPASIIKVLVAQTALAQLGEKYRFTTRLWLDDQQGLIIEGMGDPLLVSEEIAFIAQQLRNLGYSNFSSLQLDTSNIAWQLPPGSENSDNPYDAPNGALIVNFNTLYLRLKGTQVISAEPQTPTVPLASRFVDRLSPDKSTRFNLGFDKTLADTYSQQLIHAIFSREGITIANPALRTIRVTDIQAQPLIVYRNSKPLAEHIQALLKYSNNYIANQLGLIMLLETNQQQTTPTTIAQAAKMVGDYAYETLGIDTQELQFNELSGLSRANVISLAAMQQILAAFSPYANLMRDYNREANITANDGIEVRAKSGTLKNISNLAGYILHKNKTHSFIIHTDSNKNRDAILSSLVTLCRRYLL